jgi:biopolymer transport protein ExbD
VSAFAPYIPRAEPLAAEDAAEALEPVDMGLEWGKKRDEEDEDVDMIPLIDISLVLLIFFMMTASVASGVLSPIRTPPAEHQLAEISKDMVWVGVDSKSIAGAVEKGPDGTPLPWYSFGDELKTLLPPTTNGEDLLRAMKSHLDSREGFVKIRIRGDVDLPLEAVQEVKLELQGLEKTMNATRPAGKAPLAFVIYAEVSEPKRSTEP